MQSFFYFCSLLVALYFYEHLHIKQNITAAFRNYVFFVCYVLYCTKLNINEKKKLHKLHPMVFKK